MDEHALLSRLAVSLAIGLLVGLERGWRTREEDDHQRAAGFRTFALSGLLGGVAGAIGQQLGGIATATVFLGYSAAFAAFYWLEARAANSVSVTSVVAGMLTFMLGALAVVGDLNAAIAGAVAVTVLLALREQLHRWVASLSWQEIRSVLTLLAMSFLLLPILPNRPIDPWQAINPYAIWLLAILIAALSFGGYVAVRVFGDRLGVIMAAFAGGLASSTATTLTLAGLARGRGESASLLAAGILIAGLVMVLRVAAVALALNPGLLPYLSWPLAAAGVVLAIGAGGLLLGSRGSSEHPELKISNPLELGSALKMAAFIAVVMLAARLLQHYFGDAGVLATAALSGIADVDAVVISMSRMALGAIEPAIAGWAILLATAVNTVVKAGLAASTGGVALGLRVGVVSLAAVAAGFVVAVR